MNFVIIVAAGTGSRMNSDLPKQFVCLNEMPIVMHTINRFCQCKIVSEVILVISEVMAEFWNELCSEHEFTSPIHLTYGGRTRFESVKNGINYIEQNFKIGSEDYIAVHDAARPIITEDLVNRAFEGAYDHRAIVLGKKSIESVRMGDVSFNSAVDRNHIWLIQTPQVFHGELLLKSYQQVEDPLFTDDASVVEKMGNSIAIIEGDAKNIKITYPQDLQIAQLYLNLI